MDEQKKKRLYVIISIVGVVALVGILIYMLFIKPPAPVTEEPTPEFPVSEEAEGVIGISRPFIKRKINLIVDKLVAGPVITAENKIRFFSKEDGKYYETDFNGQNTKSPLNHTYNNIVDAEWNNEGTIALVTTTDASSTSKKWGVLDLSGSQQLNVEVDQSGGSKVLSVKLAQYDPGKYFYQRINPVLNSSKILLADYLSPNYDITEIMPSSHTELRLGQPKKDTVAYYHPPSGIAESSLYYFDTTTKEIRKVLSDIFGLSVAWSPQGQYFAYSSTNVDGYELALRMGDDSGRTIDMRADLGPVTTMPEKCVFTASGTRLYCSVWVGEIGPNYVMPDDFYKDRVSVDESIYMFQVPSGRDMRAGDLAEENPETKKMKKYHANKILIDPSERFIFFVNKEDGYLYRMDL